MHLSSCLARVAVPRDTHLSVFCCAKGQYDRIHCGAACPPAKLAALVELLRPEGGLIVTPVEPSDLRVIVKCPDGAMRQRTISQVRYSTLEARTPSCSPLGQRLCGSLGSASEPAKSTSIASMEG